MAVALQNGLARLRTSVTPTVLGVLFIAFLAFCAAYGAISLAGTKTGFALALIAAGGPLAIAAALRAPLIFPFCFFVLLVPFDNLLVTGSFGSVTKLIAMVSGAAILFWLLYTKRAVVPDRAILWWGLFIAWIFASLLWAIDPTLAYTHIITLLSLFTLYLAVSFMPVSQRSLAVTLVAVCAGGALAGIYGGWLFHRGVDVSSDGRLMLTSGDRLLDPNQFAASLILPFVIALAGVTTARNWITRGAAIVTVLLVAIGIAICGSRGGLLGICLAFAYITIRSRRHRAVYAFTGLFGLGAVLAAYGNVLARFSTAASSGGAGRTSIWGIGLAAFKASPLFGYGYSNFPLAYDKFFLLVPEHYFTHWDRAPHDLLLQTGTELGLVGLVLLGITLWNQFRVLRIIPPDHRLYPIRIALEAAYVGLALASLFLDMLEFKYLWLLFITTAVVRNAYLTQGVHARERPLSAVLPAVAERG